MGLTQVNTSSHLSQSYHVGRNIITDEPSEITDVPKDAPNFDGLFRSRDYLMLGILGFPVSVDTYNSFDTLLICFYDPMSKWQ